MNKIFNVHRLNIHQVLSRTDVGLRKLLSILRRLGKGAAVDRDHVPRHQGCAGAINHTGGYALTPVRLVHPKTLVDRILEDASTGGAIQIVCRPQTRHRMVLCSKVRTKTIVASPQ